MDTLLEAAGVALGVADGETATAEMPQEPRQVPTSCNRFDSSFEASTGRVKWFVDGCSYFWAVAEALERKP
jgi:hypothetical protein